MKALAVFPSSREVRFIDMHEPAIAGPTDVKLRILEAGICGTDREITSFQYGTPPANSPHLVIGHEALGEVVDVGSGVTGLTPGDLAVLMVRRPCPHDGCAPVPPRPAGLLHYRRFYGAWHQGGTRVHDRDRGGRSAVHGQGAEGVASGGCPAGTAHRRRKGRGAGSRPGGATAWRTQERSRATFAQSFSERAPSGCWAR